MTDTSAWNIDWYVGIPRKNLPWNPMQFKQVAWRSQIPPRRKWIPMRHSQISDVGKLSLNPQMAIHDLPFEISIYSCWNPNRENRWVFLLLEFLQQTHADQCGNPPNSYFGLSHFPIILLNDKWRFRLRSPRLNNCNNPDGEKGDNPSYTLIWFKVNYDILEPSSTILNCLDIFAFPLWKYCHSLHISGYTAWQPIHLYCAEAKWWIKNIIKGWHNQPWLYWL